MHARAYSWPRRKPAQHSNASSFAHRACQLGRGAVALRLRVLIRGARLVAPQYNGVWHCIVGRNFGSYVTNEQKHYIYFYQGQIAVLLFKTN